MNAKQKYAEALTKWQRDVADWVEQEVKRLTGPHTADDSGPHGPPPPPPPPPNTDDPIG